MNKSSLLIAVTLATWGTLATATEIKVKSPDGKAVITVMDFDGLSYSVSFDGGEVVAKSRFGIIADGSWRRRHAGEVLIPQDS